MSVKPGQLCFYDEYRLHVNQNIMFLQNPQKYAELGRQLGHIHEHIAELGVRIEIPPILLMEQENLRKVKPRILTMPVVEKAIRAVEKVGATPVPFVSFPTLPMWMEFGVGDDAFQIGGGNVMFRAFFARRVWKGRIYVSMIDDNFQSKDMIFNDDGTWEYEQAGACVSHDCPRALMTQEGVPFRIAQHEYREMVPFCICAQAGFHWSQVIKILVHVLRQHAPILHEEVDRREPLPHALGSQKRYEKRENERVEQENKKKPNYIVVSLSKPIHYRSVGQNGTTGNHLDVDTTIPVEGYWKFLIPGPGKPWKGEDMKIIFVEGFERRGIPGGGYTRLVITP